VTSMGLEFELKVFISSRDSVCDECHEELGRKAWITLKEDKGALCLSCADVDHLVFLPSGDAALTRRARKYSALSGVVLKWSSARKRYERQGLLVEAGALEKAEDECLADSEVRERRRERESVRRAEEDNEYLERFSARVRELFPGCPNGRERVIAQHACLKYSGRVGRSATAKALDESAVRLAVRAHVRHRETQYDQLLGRGYDRGEARALVSPEIDAILRRWGMKLAPQRL
jgi:predicted CXXCH cytochrome family protein